MTQSRGRVFVRGYYGSYLASQTGVKKGNSNSIAHFSISEELDHEYAAGLCGLLPGHRRIGR
jgi:hypothetical protein